MILGGTYLMIPDDTLGYLTIPDYTLGPRVPDEWRYLRVSGMWTTTHNIEFQIPKGPKGYWTIRKCYWYRFWNVVTWAYVGIPTCFPLYTLYKKFSAAYNIHYFVYLPCSCEWVKCVFANCKEWEWESNKNNNWVLTIAKYLAQRSNSDLFIL